MLVRLQNVILEMVAKGKAIEATMERLCLEVEALAPGVVCSVLTVDDAGLLHPLAAPSLPEEFSASIEGGPIGPNVGSCGTAAYSGQPVAVVDIESDPRWAAFKSLALPLGLLACWSSPIFDRHGRVMGTFAFYYREKRGPVAMEQTIVDTCLHLCTIALDRHRTQAEHHRLAFFDALTGLPNRASFNAALSKAHQDRSAPWGLLLVDIDNLKVVNDTFGHAAGDDLIRAVASRVDAHVSPGRAYRLGGDEFAVIIGADDSRLDIDAVAAGIMAALRASADCGGHTIVPCATIGSAVLEQSDQSAEAIRQNADLALYHAKETSRGQFLRYTPGLRTAITQRFRAIRDVDAALDDHRVEAHYQPIVRLDTKEIVGLEALCRLRSVDGRMVPASEFIEATSDADIARRITHRMLACVSADIRTWLDKGIAVQHVGINVGSADFQSGRLSEEITAAFGRHNVPLKHVILEVTESVYMGKSDQFVAREIKALREKGLVVALDDFGTGYASLTHLLTVPVDIIKIDKSFVDRLKPDDIGTAIIEGLVYIARKLGIRIVAEGVETAGQARQLRDLGCMMGQGYYYSMPVDSTAATALLLDLAQKPGFRGARLDQKASAGEVRAFDLGRHVAAKRLTALPGTTSAGSGSSIAR